MGYLKINKEKVTKESIEALLKLCPFNAFSYDGINLEINANCKMCKLCTRKGPEGVVTFVEEKVAAIDKSLWNDICVYVETKNDKIHNVSLELIKKARELADVNNEKVIAVLIGKDLTKPIKTLSQYDLDKIYYYEDDSLLNFNPEVYKRALVDFINIVHPSVILYGGTLRGRSLAPRVAAHFRTGLTADCTILEMKKNKDLVQNRPAFGGNIMAGIICSNNRPQMATVRYKVFSMPEKKSNPHLEIKKMPIAFDVKSRLKFIKETKKPSEIDISESEVLVAIGRGASTKEAILLATELATLLKGCVAVTRPLVEMGLFDATKQIGLSGRTVAPKLLITAGISGAVQFTAGARGSEVIVGCNIDPNAQIFDICHYGYVGDSIDFLKMLISEVKGDKNV